MNRNDVLDEIVSTLSTRKVVSGRYRDEMIVTGSKARAKWICIGRPGDDIRPPRKED